jgi:hypothetical protein
MENVWEYLRGNKLSAGVWNSYDETVPACADAWNWFSRDAVFSSRPHSPKEPRAAGVKSGRRPPRSGAQRT